MTKRQRGSRWAIRPLVPETVYTDRKEYLDYLYRSALETITRRSMSTVLLGRRRMGKTEIFKRVVNRLFFDQENPADLDHSVAPVYFSFPDTVVDRWDFSNTRLPQYSFDIVGWMQQAVESPTCPHFVTGSAMGILAREILGWGALFGRFRSKPIEPLTQYWGAELALRAGRYFHWETPEEMAPVIAERCGGNPFYIQAVAQQAGEQGKVLDSERQLGHILAVDLSSGFI